jgi:preprotein translocase subunit SecG
MGKGQIATTIILVLLLIVAFTLIFLVFRNFIGMATLESQETELSVSTPVGNINFTEKINTEDKEIIKESSKANNFLKYSISIAFILLVVGYMTYLFYREYNRNKRK